MNNASAVDELPRNGRACGPSQASVMQPWGRELWTKHPSVHAIPPMPDETPVILRKSATAHATPSSPDGLLVHQTVDRAVARSPYPQTRTDRDGTVRAGRITRTAACPGGRSARYLPHVSGSRGWHNGGVPLDGLHGDRSRAESFGIAAEQYDRCRPDYPSALVDQLMSRQPANGLDVGCGTGKVARVLEERGVPVLGIEPDPRMAEVARRHRVRVELASFESWDPAGRTFDLLTAGHSWHWIDPAVGLAKAAEVTRPGGTVALFWNYHVVEDGLLDAFDDVYRAVAPGLTTVGRDPNIGGKHDADPFEGRPEFTSVGNRTYRWPRVQDAQGWTLMLGTLSDHAGLGESRLRELQGGLREVIERAGGWVPSLCGTYVWTALRADPAKFMGTAGR